MVLEWTDSKIINLLTHVKKLPALYDKSSADYENKDLKAQLWETTAKKLGTSSRDCRRKWTGMCLKYNKFKEASSESVDGDEWPWQDHMSFIDPDAIKKGEESKMEASVTNSSVAAVQTNGGVADETDTVKEQGKAVPAVALAAIHVPPHIVSSSSLPNVSQVSVESSVNVSRNVVASTASSSVELTNGLGLLSGSQRNENGNRLFLESLVSDLSSLSLSDQYDFKANVLGLMRKYVQKSL